MDPKKSDTNVKAAADVLMAQANEAAAIFTQYDQEQVDKIVAAAAKAGAAQRLELAHLAVEETGMGIFEDKVIKNLFATEYIYNDIRDIKTVGLIHDCPATGLMEYAEPLGVVLGITPITNPTSTVMFKSLIALKTRNAIVFCASRNALKCSNEAARIIYEAAVAAGAPDYVIRWVEEPSREMTQALMTHPNVALILATGGTGLVQAAYGSGKPAIGVGPGNVPVYIDKSADIPMAVNDILLSKTFDNGMICASEQAIVVHRDIRQAVEDRLVSQGAYFLKPSEVAVIQDIVIDPAKQSMSSKVVGKSAQYIAELAGIKVPPQTRLLLARLADVGETVPLSREKLCPLLGYYVAANLDEAINICTNLTHFGGLGHSVSIFSRDQQAIDKFSRTLNAGRILVNSPSALGGIGDIYNRLHPSLTLGCGTGGCNITTDNVTVTHLLNIKRVSKRMVNMKWFRVPSKIYFEPGCLDVFFTHEIKDLGAKRALIVCSGSAVREGTTDRVAAYLKAAGIQSSVFSDVKSDPTVETITAGVAVLNKEKPDLIIALGGGSPIDAAKAMWLMYEHPEFSFDDLRLRFMDIRKRIVKLPPLGQKARFIAIPTTSGTGSEVTAFTVVTDSKAGKKYPIADYAITPDIAIIDPNLVLTVPPTVTADTGLDVLSHAMESYVSTVASDYTDPLALRAIQLVFEYLPQAFLNGGNALAREKMHNASTIAGMAFTNAFLGINHCLAHILGATFHIPHGRANAFVMIPVIRYNAALPHKFPPSPNYPSPKAKDRYAEIAAVLKLDTSTPEKGVENLVRAMAELKKTLGVPASLRAAGVPEADFKAKLRFMAEVAFDDQCAGANPSYPLVDDLIKVLEEAYG
ncbi:MAG: bifunctional acetaldehyde-CoA/alcohol dehydrogenase [Verrucomicrobia bacterium]|nr:bifunctional acetaldehyde-CoA/alcohol dehydrogenase [Verrucomicrobiota bacterium]MBU1734941.1 bifunctional acetaldehyde-CoA/alcohol dehydrogenase [Verrucomicrobiota bacterium]MBU1857902.1 bifunctional acetaldehyde-CoA/alcohol dehydrogenase [Verrucomicrobiota bacterium]